MDVLRKINIFYNQNRNVVENEGILPYKGPQTFDDRLDKEKLYYYGNGIYKWYRSKTLHEFIEEDYGCATLEEFKSNPLTNKISRQDFEHLLHKVNKNVHSRPLTLY